MWKAADKDRCSVHCQGPSSYCVVEEHGFLDLIAAVVPGFVVIPQTAFSSCHLVPVRTEVRQVKSELCSCFSGSMKCYSTTTDGWASHRRDGSLSVTCQVLDLNATAYSYILACWDVPQGHTAGNCMLFCKLYVCGTGPSRRPACFYADG